MRALLEQLEGLLDTGSAGPRVVRLDGPGARSLAAGWAVQAGIARSVDPRQPADDTPIWLDDAPGARITADLLVARCFLQETPRNIVLTGIARDGGHPRVGSRLEVPALPPHPGDPTAIDLDLPAVTEIERLAGEGDLLRAHALWETLPSTEARTELAWLDLLRLRTTGRLDEVDQRATTLPSSPTSRARLLLQMSAARYWARDFQRARRYAQAVRQLPAPDVVQADADYLADRAGHALGGPLRDVLPGTTWWRANAYRLRARRDPAWRDALAALPGPYAPVALRELDGLPVDPETLVGMGHLQHAFRAHANQHGSTVGSSLYEADGDLRRVMDRTLDELVAGRLTHARDHLEAVRDELQAQGAFFGTLWLLLWGRTQSALGDVPATLFAIAGLERRAQAVGTEIAALGLPASDPSLPVWTTTSWLRALSTVYPDLGDRVDPLLRALPQTPVVLGPYALVAPIASGGMGTVWRGRHVLTETPVAVKVLDDRPDRAQEAFRREATLVAGFSHPAIVTVLDLLDVDRTTVLQANRFTAGRPTIVMEHLDGGTLSDQLGELDWVGQRRVLLSLLDALAYAHAHGVIHRDLKPANVLLTRTGQVRLSDFGVSALAHERVVGTPAYMAPEQFTGGAVGPPADLYALGCLAWALATGIPPYLGRPEQLRHAHLTAPLPGFEPMEPLPAPFTAWLARCLAKDPRDRFPTAVDAAVALTAVDGDAPSPLEALDTGRPWRPTIPTRNLLHHGDPPLLGQERAQEALWATLLAVQRRGCGRRVLLNGPPGQGHRLLVRWLWQRAHRAGLQPLSRPTPGRLCIVDCTDGAPPTLATDEPWLLLWRRNAPPDAMRVDLEVLDDALTWWALQMRIRLAPSLAARAAVDSLGTPGLAIHLVEDWLEEPGVRMEREGLVLHRPEVRTGPRAAAWWERTRQDWTPELNELARLVSITRPRARGEDLRRAARASGASLDLRKVANGVNDAWRMPQALRHCFVDLGSPDDHALLARTVDVPLDRAVHGLLADPSEERTREVVTFLTRRVERLDHRTARVLELHLDLHLLREERGRLLCHLVHQPTRVLDRLADEPGWRGDLALIRLVHQARPPGTLQRLRQRLERAEDPAVRTWLAVHLATTSLLRGRPAEARPEVEQVIASLPTDHPDHPLHRDLLLWARCNTAQGEDSAVHQVTEALGQVTDHQVRRLLHSDLAHHHLEAGAWDEALTSLEGARGGWSVVPDYNRLVAHLGRGDLPSAAALAQRVVTSAVARMDQRTLPGLVAVLLVHHLERRDPIWDRLQRLAQPVQDPLLARLLGEHLAQRSSSSRSARVAELLSPRA